MGDMLSIGNSYLVGKLVGGVGLQHHGSYLISALTLPL